jgi:hypothetical protein
LRKLGLERPQHLFIRPAADCNDLLAHRSPEREGTPADHEVTSAVAQLEPKQTVSGERRDSAQAASEGCAKMIVIECDRGNESELPSVIRSNPHAHRTRDRYLVMKELFCLKELLFIPHERKVSPRSGDLQSPFSGKPHAKIIISGSDFKDSPITVLVEKLRREPTAEQRVSALFVQGVAQSLAGKAMTDGSSERGIQTHYGDDGKPTAPATDWIPEFPELGKAWESGPPKLGWENMGVNGTLGVSVSPDLFVVLDFSLF